MSKPVLKLTENEVAIIILALDEAAITSQFKKQIERMQLKLIAYRDAVVAAKE